MYSEETKSAPVLTEEQKVQNAEDQIVRKVAATVGPPPTPGKGGFEDWRNKFMDAKASALGRQ